jgi:hypothetical protein
VKILIDLFTIPLTPPLILEKQVIAVTIVGKDTKGMSYRLPNLGNPIALRKQPTFSC